MIEKEIRREMSRRYEKDYTTRTQHLENMSRCTAESSVVLSTLSCPHWRL